MENSYKTLLLAALQLSELSAMVAFGPNSFPSPEKVLREGYPTVHWTTFVSPASCSLGEMAVLLQTRFCGGFPKLFYIVSDSTQCCMNCRHLSPLHLQSAEIDQSCRRCWAFFVLFLQFCNIPTTLQQSNLLSLTVGWHNGTMDH